MEIYKLELSLCQNKNKRLKAETLAMVVDEIENVCILFDCVAFSTVFYTMYYDEIDAKHILDPLSMVHG